MITALQNLISGKMGKVFFTLLLLIIVVSFVLYLSQGNSVFDHLGESGRKRDFYGHDLNDVDVNRYLSVSHSIAADVGAVVVPDSESLQAASARFHPEVPRRMQANIMGQYQEFMAQMGSVPPEQQQNLHQLFRRQFERVQGLMNNWNFFPDPVRARIISRENPEDKEFEEASVKAKLALEHIADLWDLLPPETEEASVVVAPYVRHVGELDPTLALNDGNRSRIFGEIGAMPGHGLSINQVDDVIFSYYRAAKVDEVLSATGFALEEEAELDLLTENLAWSVDGVSLSEDDLDLPDETFAMLTLKEQPKSKEHLGIRLPGKMLEFKFLAEGGEDNSTAIKVVIDPAGVSATRDNLRDALEKADPGFLVLPEGNATLALVLDDADLPSGLPVLGSPSASLEIKAVLESRLRAFHEERKNQPPFQEPAGVVVTAVTFAMSQHMEEPSEPTEAALRRYFEANKDSFAPPAPPPPPPAPPAPEGNASDGQPGPEGETGPEGDANATPDRNVTVPTASDQGTESNASEALANVLAELNATASDSNSTEPPTPVVTFDLVRAEVRERVMERDRQELEEDAWTLARDDAAAFLGDLQKASGKLRRNYKTYHGLRNSSEIKELIEKYGANPRPITFSEKNIAVQTALFGFSNMGGRSPLQEATKLTESKFFSRSLSKARDGYVVFLYDGGTESEPGRYLDTPFTLLYREYRNDVRAQAFKKSADDLVALLEKAEGLPKDGIHSKVRTVSIVEKSGAMLDASYQKRSQKLDSARSKLTEERDEIVRAESNATAEEAAAHATRKAEIDEEIETIREQNADLAAERGLAERIFREAFETGIQSGWKELERTDSAITYLNVRKAFLNASRPDEEEVEERLDNLSLRRADEARGDLVRDLVKAGDKKADN